MKSLFRWFAAILAFSVTSLFAAGNLTVTLMPAGAIGAGAQWRVDGGAWRNSGTTAKSLTSGSHTVEFKSVSGWIAPSSRTATITNGNTTTLSATYVQTASLQLSLSPASGQWRIDGGAWRASGSAATNLAPGSHTIDYAPVSGYATPASESIALSAGQSLSLARNYIQFAQLSISLSPSTGQWRLNGGPWQASGATLANLAPGSYAVQYSTLAPNWGTPPAENVSLVAGQSLAFTRNYTALGQVLIGLVPSSGTWRVDGGAWQASGTSLWVPAGTHTLDYSALANYDAPPSESFVDGIATTRYYVSTKPTLRIHLSPGTGQWRLDGGAWQTSGAQLTELNAGTHTVDYSDVGGDYAPLASETISLSLRQNAVLSRSYPLKPGALSVTLTPANAQWSVDGGAWQASGATVTGLVAGNHTVSFSHVDYYTQPAPETVVINANQTATLSRAYGPAPAFVSIRTSPTTGQWRVFPVGATPAGTWHTSGETVQVAPGDYRVEYSALAGYNTPPTETISLASTQYLLFDRAYTITPAQLQVTLDHTLGGWRIETQTGSYWGSGSTLTLAPGTYTIDYRSVTGFAAPATETIMLAPGQTASLNRSYTALPTGSLSIALDPPDGRWSVNNGPWQPGGAIVTAPTGNNTVAYAFVSGYATPPTETVAVVGGETTTLTRTYVRVTKLTVTVNPFGGDWRIDGGAWRASGSTITGIATGSHTIEYWRSDQFDPPPTETITIAPGDQISLVRAHAPITQVSVSLYPTNAQWRLDGGAWQSSGFVRTPAGQHTIDYQSVSGYLTPPSETVTVVQDQTLWVTRSYGQFGQLRVNLNAPGAQWRLDGGPWQAGGATLDNVTPDTAHTISFSDATGFVAPPSQSVTLYGGEQRTVTAFYSPLSSVTVNVNAPAGRWRVDAGAWQSSGATVSNLSFDVPHAIDFETITGYVAPPPQSVTLYSGEHRTVTAFYSPLSSVTVNVNAPAGRWRVDAGAWQSSGATVSNLSFDVSHAIDFETITGYVAPPPQSVTLYSGESRTVTAFYSPLSSVTVNVNAPAGRWRVDAGAWQSSGATVSNLSFDVSHAIDFETITGYVAPPPQSVTLYSSEHRTVTAFYAPLASITANLNAPGAEWRVDGGAWQAGGTTASSLSFDVVHRVEFRGLRNYFGPSPQNVTLYSGESRTLTAFYEQIGAHRLRFFIHPDLAGALPAAEVQRRLAQYAAHLIQVLHRETNRLITFQESDVTISAVDPFSGATGAYLPEGGFEIWVQAVLTDNSSVGTYGGAIGTDSSGAGGVRALRWDQIHDPAALADGSAALAQYWRQLHLITRHLEQMFGAGAAGYDSLGGMKDASGVAPVLADVAAADSLNPDAFWNARFDFWTDPLTANAHANPRLGSPTSLATLLQVTSFAPVTRELANRRFRNAVNLPSSLPDLSTVAVKVVNAQTGAPIANANVRVWNRSQPTPPYGTFEESVSTTATAGVFRFAWTGTGAPFADTANAKMLKASAPGYAPTATWFTVYDAQLYRLTSESYTWEITVALTPE